MTQTATRRRAASSKEPPTPATATRRSKRHNVTTVDYNNEKPPMKLDDTPKKNLPQDNDPQSHPLIDFLLVPAALLIIIVAVLYREALNCGLVFDDVSAITNNKDIRSTSPVWQLFKNDFWGTPIRQEYSHKSYRPLTVLTYRLNHGWTGTDPYHLHLTNLIIYAIVCHLFYMISRKFMSLHASLVATAIFTTHPIHTEAVTGIVGRAELLMSMFALLAFILYERVSSSTNHSDGWLIKITSYILCLACAGASFFSKEQGISIIPVLAVYEILIASDATWYQMLNLPVFIRQLGMGPILRIFGLLSMGAFIFCLRLYIMGGILPEFTRFDNPASYEDYPTRHLTFNFLLPMNLWLLIYPKDLLCDWSMGTIPLVESFLDVRNLATLLFYLTLAIMIYLPMACKDTVTRFVLILGLAITVFTYLPASNLFVYVGFTIAERVLFMPSVGVCMILGYVLSKYLCKFSTNKSALSSRNLLGHAILGIVVALFAYRTHLRNYDWHDDLTLFKSGLQVTNNNAKLYNNIGHVYEKRSQLDEALKYYNKAAETQSDDIGSFINLGRIYYSLKQYPRAKEQFLRAKDLLPKPKPGMSYQTRIAPNHLDVFLHLANLEGMDPNNYKSVVSLLTQVIRMRPDYTKARLTLAKFYLDRGAKAQAKDTYLSALKYSPGEPDIYYNLGVLSYHDDRYDDARKYCEQALKLDSSHTRAKFTWATVMQETNQTSNYQLAKQYLLSLIDHTSGTAQSVDTNVPLDAIYYNLAMLASEQDDKYSESVKWFKLTIVANRKHRSALYNLAFIQYRNGQERDALNNIDHLLDEHPAFFKGHLLKGHILYDRKDFAGAKQSYERALKNNPKSDEANAGLCEIYLRLDGPEAAREKGCKVVQRSSSDT